LKTTHRLQMTDEYIAEAQRLSIEQNKALRFMYQTWWVWWVPRLGMIGFIVYFVVEGFDWILKAEFGAFLALSVFGEWWGRRRLAAARIKMRSDDPITVSMDKNGFDIVGVNSTSHSNWIAMPVPLIRANGVFLKLSRLSGIWLPDNVLSEGTPEDVRALLAENISDAAPAAQAGVPK
jgi:hypothetical protein